MKNSINNITSTTVAPVNYQTLLEEFLINEIELAIPALIPGLAYTLEKILGPAIWKIMSPHDHKIAGKCMAWLVRTGRIPMLRFSGKTPSNENLYRLK